MDRTWITLSDSLTTCLVRGTTTGELKVMCNDTVKWLTFPADEASWRPGEFAAIVLTSGRADFDSGTGQPDAAIAVLESALHGTTSSPVTSLGGLVDALWEPVQELWYRTCSACAAVRDELRALYVECDPDPGPAADEYMCEKHSDFSIVAIGINSSDGLHRVHREWGAGPDADCLASCEFRTAGHESNRYLVVGTQLDDLFGRVDKLFNDIVKESNMSYIETAAGGVGPIGGTRDAWILSPATGFERRPTRPLTAGTHAEESA